MRRVAIGTALAAALAAVGATPTQTNDTTPAAEVVIGQQPTKQVPVQAPTVQQLSAIKAVELRKNGSLRVRWRKANRQPWVLRKRGGRLVAIHVTHGRGYSRRQGGVSR